MSNSYYFKPVDQLTFADNWMFQAVLRDKEICTEFVERLLHIKIKNIEYPELEKSIAPFYTSKGIRLDVYLKDEDKVIDVEIQTYPQEALGKRTRYYQSMIDMDSLMKGHDYTELKDSYILFICQFDPFKTSENSPGLPRYTFRSRCDESDEINLNDKCLKVIYNASAYREDKETFRQEYSAVNLHDRDLIRMAKRDGIEEGKAQANLEDAVTVVKSFNVSPEVAAEKLNVPLEELQKALKEA